MNYLRRLPVYLVIDVSESMAGPAIEAVNAGVKTLVDTLKNNPLALESAYLSVITFARKAEQVVPLSELMTFTPPKLSVRTGSALGAAMKLLVSCIKKEVVKTTPTTKGDYKPLVFLLTDGQPTDNWQAAADELRKANNPRIANLYAIGCGPDVDPDVLRQISDIVLMMNDLSPEGFKKFFVWLSASVSTASMKLESAGAFDMPPLPKGIEVPSEDSEYDPTPRQVFLQARCQKTRKPFLMRFGRREWDERYEAISAHTLEVLEEDASDFLPPISTDMLDGCPSCPYCENDAAGACPCGILFCNTANPKGPVICPGCRAQLSKGSGGSFDIKRSMG